MTEKQIERLVKRLWEKHGHPDAHGYKDWMSPYGFDAAIREVLAAVSTGKVNRRQSG